MTRIDTIIYEAYFLGTCLNTSCLAELTEVKYMIGLFDLVVVFSCHDPLKVCTHFALVNKVHMKSGDLVSFVVWGQDGVMHSGH